MEAGRHTWTDSRPDDLQHEMRSGFARLDADLRRIDGRIDGLQRTMLQLGGGVIVAPIGSIAAQL